MADEPKIVPRRPTTSDIAGPTVVPRKSAGDIAPPSAHHVSIGPTARVPEDIRIVARPKTSGQIAHAERERQHAEDQAALAQWAEHQRHAGPEPVSPVIREDELNAALARGEKQRAKQFMQAIETARKALTEARELLSEISVEKAIRRIEHEIARARKADGRNEDELLALIGASKEELEALPILFFTTVTIVPVEGAGIATWTTREPRRRQTKIEPSQTTIEVDGKVVEVVYFGGRPVTASVPIPQLTPGGPIGAAKPKIIPRVDGSYRLELGDVRYRMRRERSQAVDGQLIGDDWWLYYPLSEGTYDPTAPLLRTFSVDSDGRKAPTGFTTDPPSDGPTVLADYVEDPLWAITMEVDDRKVAIATVLMKGGNIVHVEVPWHDDLVKDAIELGTLRGTEWTNWAIGLATFDEAVNLHRELQASTLSEAGDPSDPAPFVSA